MDGLDEMTEGYPYTACGLDYVYLLNGYTEHETKHGPAIAIKEARKLHEAIARDIIGSHRPIGGQEVRFLRSQLKLSQDGLAKALGTRRGSVARWEAAPDKAIPGAADRALRMFYALKAEGHDVAVRLVELLSEIDDLEHELHALRTSTFQESNDDWTRLAVGF
jgi:DNA-binding transcriptional regulator YiaG